jgi:hypothetical protein
MCSTLDCGQGNYVCNNRATLRTDNLRLIARCRWGDGDGTTGC